MWTLPAPTESTQSGEKSLPLEILYGVQDIQQNIQQNPVKMRHQSLSRGIWVP